MGSHPACTLVMKEELGIALQHYKIIPYGSDAAELHSLAPLGMEVMLNGQQVDNEPLPLSDRDTITTGDLKLIFRLTDPALDEIKPTALLEKKFEGETPTGQAAREIAASDAPVPNFQTPAPVAGQSHLAPLALESLETAEPSGPGQLPEVSPFTALELETVVPTQAMDALPPAEAAPAAPLVEAAPEAPLVEAVAVAPLPVEAESAPEIVAPVSPVIEEVPVVEAPVAVIPVEAAPALPQVQTEVVAPPVVAQPVAEISVEAVPPIQEVPPLPVAADPIPAEAPLPTPALVVEPLAVPAAENTPSVNPIPAPPEAAPAPVSPMPVAQQVVAVSPTPAAVVSPIAAVAPVATPPVEEAPQALPVSPEPAPVAAQLPGAPAIAQPSVPAPAAPVSAHSSRPSELFLPKKDAPKRATDAGRRADAARRTSMRLGFCVLGIIAAVAWVLVAVYAFVDPARNMIHDLVDYDPLAKEKVRQIEATVDAKNPVAGEIPEAAAPRGVAGQ